MTARSPRTPRFPLALDRLQAPARSRVGAAADELLRPQRPLQHAAQAAAQSSTPSGLGLDSAAVRQRMVARLREQGLRCEPVLAALGQVERHRFVDSALATQAYEDTSLPIGLSQTISKPSVVGHMLALLFEGAHARAHGDLGRVLEIGTGCGYQAALLALLARSVVSIERLRGLHDKARANLAHARRGDLRLVFGDGRDGHTLRAPYQSIIAAAGGEELPPAWIDQLDVGGRLVAPLQDATSGGQVLLVVDREPGGLVSRRLDAVNFVPLKSGTA
ncbi:Protein-L-isoaspartate O-methyltransferase [Rubrivivax sp. A210]|uniref:protein-L-isoaspartate O-methyltransferase n=1 Tax=Rubrivivax sp. A210 TaxID=2772301 RepID=UPI001919F65E|nr:protein-L-isoaspartate O-methyltransferase [Rubrivivax sp. A210]CAD5373930.1 Protein-L-isoaspartate O-methyltransferase [Rubrivivax sp. A210]